MLDLELYGLEEVDFMRGSYGGQWLTMEMQRILAAKLFPRIASAIADTGNCYTAIAREMNEEEIERAILALPLLPPGTAADWTLALGVNPLLGSDRALDIGMFYLAGPHTPPYCDGYAVKIARRWHKNNISDDVAHNLVIGPASGSRDAMRKILMAAVVARRTEGTENLPSWALDELVKSIAREPLEATMLINSLLRRYGIVDKIPGYVLYPAMDAVIGARWTACYVLETLVTQPAQATFHRRARNENDLLWRLVGAAVKAPLAAAKILERVLLRDTPNSLPPDAVRTLSEACMAEGGECAATIYTIWKRRHDARPDNRELIEAAIGPIIPPAPPS